MALNLERQMVFYGQYHHNHTNIAIHMTFVPLILATGLILGTNSGPVISLPSWVSIPYLPPNIGVIAAYVYAATYILLEPVAGAMLTPFIIGCGALGSYLTASSNAHTVNTYATILQVISWIAQFIGHGKFEGRAPALLDNLVQAFLLAPMFVWLEFLFTIGYRPELKSRLDKQIEEALAKYRMQKADGKSSGKAQ